MSTKTEKLIITELQTWLEANYQKISTFWLYAEWRIWARFDLFAHLERTIGLYGNRMAVIRHSRDIWDENDADDVDIVVVVMDPGPVGSEEEQQDVPPVPVRICTAFVTENDTSFGRFVDRYRQDWGLLRELAKKDVDPDHEVRRVLLVGLGEKAYESEDVEFGGLKPMVMQARGSTQYEPAVCAYCLWLDLPKQVDGTEIPIR